MKRMNLRKTMTAAALIGATIMTTNVLAETPQSAYGSDDGMGPGMMGGGMGHGMMGGMMDGGMMGGYGHCFGMGPGMMGGCYPGADLDLTAEQRSNIAKIQNDVRRKRWDLMGKMQDEQALMNEQYYSDARDDAVISASYRKMLDLRAQMFDLSLSARKQIDAVLSKEQHEKLKSR